MSKDSKIKKLATQLGKAIAKELEQSPMQDEPAHWALVRSLVNDCAWMDRNLQLRILFAVRYRDVAMLLSIADEISQSLSGRTDVAQAMVEYQLASLLKKFPFNNEESPVDRQENAMRRFNDAELLCRLTNKRLKYYSQRPWRLQRRYPLRFEVLESARKRIAKWLAGPDGESGFPFSKLWEGARHGPGAAIGVGGRNTTAYYKYAADTYTVTSLASDLFQAAVLNIPSWRRHLWEERTGACLLYPFDPMEDAALRDYLLDKIEITDQNKVTFVPKDAKTLRSIAIEPLGNIYLQLSVGRMLREILRKQGLDLTSQELNRNLAAVGSTESVPFFERPCTIDLSMASDTVSVELVKYLLPSDWYTVLYRLRSPKGALPDGTTVVWEKFSSMGNGYTFELESMIFYALLLSTAEVLETKSTFCTVFGDDIICEAKLVPLYLEVLRLCGFRVNSDKSFIVGHFRESCGSDWLNGVDIRPFFLKEELKGEAAINAYNSLRHRDLYFDCSGRRLYDGGESEVFQLFRSTIGHTAFRVLVGPFEPDLHGRHRMVSLDIGLHSPLVKWDRTMRHWRFPSLKKVPILYRGRSSARLIQFMEGVHGSSGRTNVPLELWYLLSRPGRSNATLRDGISALSLAMSVSDWVKAQFRNGSSSRGDITKRDAVVTKLGYQVTCSW